MQITTQKKALRAKIRQQRLEFPETLRKQYSLQAQEHLIGSQCWRDANIVALYMALPLETGTELLIKTALTEGKTVLLPSVDDPSHQHMIFVHVHDLDELGKGAFGILQPDGAPYLQSPDLLLVPGLAFDCRYGWRMGNGFGYYDRFLAQNNWNCTRIGFCFAWQKLNDLPHDEYDCRVNAICTEEGLQWL